MRTICTPRKNEGKTRFMEYNFCVETFHNCFCIMRRMFVFSKQKRLNRTSFKYRMAYICGCDTNEVHGIWIGRWRRGFSENLWLPYLTPMWKLIGAMTKTWARVTNPSYGWGDDMKGQKDDECGRKYDMEWLSQNLGKYGGMSGILEVGWRDYICGKDIYFQGNANKWPVHYSVLIFFVWRPTLVFLNKSRITRS